MKTYLFHSSFFEQNFKLIKIGDIQCNKIDGKYVKILKEN